MSEGITAGQVRASEQLDALVIVNVCVQGSGHKRTGVTDDHLLPEAFGK